MDETTMQLGLLMEAARVQQKLAESSLERMETIERDLVTLVQEELRRALVDQLQSVCDEARRTGESLRAMRRAANVRVAVWSVGIVTLCSGISLSLTWWTLPSPTYIASLRTESDRLTSQIALLRQNGGRIDLRKCGEGGRLCVRVDRKAPAYGEKGDYLIVGGY